MAGRVGQTRNLRKLGLSKSMKKGRAICELSQPSGCIYITHYAITVLQGDTPYSTFIRKFVENAPNRPEGLIQLNTAATIAQLLLPGSNSGGLPTRPAAQPHKLEPNQGRGHLVIEHSVSGDQSHRLNKLAADQ